MTFDTEYDVIVNEMGILPSVFWTLTPAEMYGMVTGYRKNQTLEANKHIVLAWNTAALSRQDKIPDLKTLLIDDSPKKSEPMTDEQMLAKARVLNALWGGEVLEV